MTSTKVIAAGALTLASNINANLDENTLASTTQKVVVSFVVAGATGGENAFGTVRINYVTAPETGITDPWNRYKNEVRFIEAKLNLGHQVQTYAASEAFVPKGAYIYCWTENGTLTIARTVDVYVNEVTA